MTSQKKTVRYQLLAPLQAVRLESHHGSSLRDPTADLIEIPAGSVIETEGHADSSGLINILWNGQAFSVFDEDLREKAQSQTAQGS